MIEYYHYPMSSNAQIVTLVLLEKGLAWSDHIVDLGARENLSPAYLEINPEGTVPALVHGDRTLTESSVIARYLDRFFPEPPLMPSDPAAGADVDFWFARQAGLQQAAHNITYALMYHARLESAPPEVRKALIEGIPDPELQARRARVLEAGLDAPDLRISMRYFKRSLALLEERIAGDFVVGPQLTLADLLLLPYVHRLSVAGQESLWGGEQTSVGKWYARMKERPSARRALVELVPATMTDALREAGQTEKDRLGALVA